MITKDRRLPVEVLEESVWRQFGESEKRHLFLTGNRGIGKTTLRRALTGQITICGGIESWAVRPNPMEPTEKVVLNSLTDPSCQIVIGLHGKSGMTACPSGFRKSAEILTTCMEKTGEWIVIDEIGYLESDVPDYQQCILDCLEKKRVLACLRKANTSFLCALMARKDACLIDLDEFLTGQAANRE